MNRFVKGVALFVAIACVVWIAVLWRWQVTARDMTTPDIVIYLGLLPIAVFVFAAMSHWAWRGASERADAREARRAEVAASPAGTAAAPGSDEAERYRTVQLLAAHLSTAAGASAGELISAARDGSPRPQLDDELRDDDGMPVLVARIAGLDGAAIEDESEPHLLAARLLKPEWGQGEVAEHVWRALAALQEPLAAALDSLLPWAARLAAAPEPAAAEPAGPERSVRVLVGWPAAWSEFEQEVGRRIVTAWLAERSAHTLPEVRVAISAQAVGGDELLLQADRLMLTLARAAHYEPVIVAACHSEVGSAALEALERDGSLYHSQRRPKGRMPAEAAAALVLAGAEWPAAEGEDEPLPHLHRPAIVRRGKSIDAPGRVGAQSAREAIEAALAGARLEASAIAALLSDADQHTERAAEFFVAAAESVPQLEAGVDIVGIGHVTAAVGGVGALLVVACAAELARNGEAPCLALTLGDPFSRLAMVVLPAAPAVPASAAASPAAPPVNSAA